MTATWRRVSGRGMVVRMSTDFDPYHRWLGIPPKHQPADHYRLLAIERFEDDPEVIADAAERQIAHVRRYALGPHQDISQRILNELAAAKVCLLNPDKKAEYDRKLREQVAPQDLPVPQVVPPSVSPLPPVVAPVGTRSEMPAIGVNGPGPVPVVTDRSRHPMRAGRARLPRSRRTQMSAVAVVGWAAGGGILLGLLAVVLWSLFSGRGVDDVAQAGRLKPSSGQSLAAEPTPEVKPDAKPAKSDTPAIRQAKPAEAPAEPKVGKEPAKPESAKTELEKTEPAAKASGQKDALYSSGVRPMDSAENAHLREQIDRFAEMGRAEESKLQKSVTGSPHEIENSIGMRFKLIPAREFLMGSPDGDSDAWPGEKPQHLVRITKPFYLGVTEVTQEQYERVMGQNPSYFKGDPERPVEMVSWEDAVAFCRKFSEQEGQTYRLPTEAEWEYACRARSQTKWSFGDDPAGLTEHAWFDRNSEGTTHPVAQKKPNAFGLYDVHGNVWEWCADWCGEKYYGESPQADPQGPAAGWGRVSRGGCWEDVASVCRASYRRRYAPGDCYGALGFRLVRECPASFP
ncbi:MAG: SUMF1/EgtB/PvdO family nonheme iron enzyme [Candidatus Anammoximicrobium sp.]|nr:SUMF1/EgtB/PvdO family nonheme iron enzyme [Candidatus Anammoximicrobium sp.]